MMRRQVLTARSSCSRASRHRWPLAAGKETGAALGLDMVIHASFKGILKQDQPGCGDGRRPLVGTVTSADPKDGEKNGAGPDDREH
jgi:hypothetical protein